MSTLNFKEMSNKAKEEFTPEVKEASGAKRTNPTFSQMGEASGLREKELDKYIKSFLNETSDEAKQIAKETFTRQHANEVIDLAEELLAKLGDAGFKRNVTYDIQMYKNKDGKIYAGYMLKVAGKMGEGETETITVNLKPDKDGKYTFAGLSDSFVGVTKWAGNKVIPVTYKDADKDTMSIIKVIRPLPAREQDMGYVVANNFAYRFNQSYKTAVEESKADKIIYPRENADKDGKYSGDRETGTKAVYERPAISGYVKVFTPDKLGYEDKGYKEKDQFYVTTFNSKKNDLGFNMSFDFVFDKAGVPVNIIATEFVDGKGKQVVNEDNEEYFEILKSGKTVSADDLNDTIFDFFQKAMDKVSIPEKADAAFEVAAQCFADYIMNREALAEESKEAREAKRKSKDEVKE